VLKVVAEVSSITSHSQHQSWSLHCHNSAERLTYHWQLPICHSPACHLSYHTLSTWRPLGPCRLMTN